MNPLREAAQQTLEACEQRLPLVGQATIIDELNALRAALAQEQAEPNISRCPKCNGPADNGFARSFPPSPYICKKCMAEPVAWMSDSDVGFDKSEFGATPTVPLYAAPPRCPNCASLEAQNTELDRRLAEMEQAEPAQEPGTWVASSDGRVIYDDASTDDGLLRVSGDFENDEQRLRYAQRIAAALNAASPRRTMVPLTDEEIVALVRPIVMADMPDEMTDYEIARAIEKASWEKNNG